MSTKFTLEQLRTISFEARDQLSRNAQKLRTPEAREIIDLLVKHDLLVTKGGGLPNNHPLILQVEEIARSKVGVEAARAATESGLPGMAGVDPLLQAALGEQYGPLGTTNWAGQFVAEELRKLGYKQMGQRPLPPGCVAKTAAFFTPSK